jgi:hypothetical protein
MKLPKILTKQGLREFRKTKEFKDLKYFFAPNMNDKKYLLYNLFLILIVFVIYVMVR